MTMRIVALAAVMAWAPALARADSPLLHPSQRALAAAGDDEPPPHADPRAQKATPARKAEPEEETPIYKKWWFWALTGAVVGGTVIFGVAAFKPAQHLPAACDPMAVACFGDGRPP
ncbi:MAG TPA: hypothetical protein VN914_15845 [Polyangia bacterium]|nr:hypothetical protein [Polyangia bacterium]